MNSFMEAQMFFFISSVGFVILGVLAAIILVEGVFVVASFLRIMSKIEGNINDISDTTRELIEDMRDSMVFRLLFKPRRKFKK
jgi:hypothetical protein